ncbi:MAG: hypothetical protein ACKO96_04885 [Flammeovirgaceae bacterium]
MNNPIETLLNLYEVDKSKKTTDKMAQALKVAGEALQEIIYSPNYEFDDDTYEHNDVLVLKNGYNDIYHIAKQALEAISNDK